MDSSQGIVDENGTPMNVDSMDRRMRLVFIWAPSALTLQAKVGNTLTCKIVELRSGSH